MLLAWKKAQRFEASTFLLMDSVCAPLPSVSESARQSAITAISSAIFLFLPVACSAVSACSMLSCALMIFSRRGLHHTIDRTTASLQGVKAPAPLGREFQHVYARVSCAGMGAAIDLQQPLGIDARINLRRRKRSMAEQFLNRAQVAAAAQQVRRERMPKRVRGRGVGQAERAAQAFHGELNDARAERPAASAHKDRALRRQWMR